MSSLPTLHKFESCLVHHSNLFFLELQVLSLDNYEAKPRDDLEEDDRTRRLDLSEDEDGSSGDEQ